MRATPGRPPRALRLARIIGLDGNPLRRASDRAEAWVRIGVIVLFVIIGPIATIAAGHWAYDVQATAIRTQAVDSHAVKAVLLQPTTTPDDMALARLGGQVWARARWHRAGAPAQTPAQTGEVPAPAGLAAGRQVTVWLDNTGQVIEPPDRGGVVDAVAFTTVITLGFVGLALLAMLRGIQLLLNRRRLAAWESAWSAIDPRWTGRRQG